MPLPHDAHPSMHTQCTAPAKGQAFLAHAAREHLAALMYTAVVGPSLAAVLLAAPPS